MIPAGAFGLHVRFGNKYQEPTADYTCRCGHASSAQGAAAVAKFVATAAADHKARCPLVPADKGSGDGRRVRS